MKIEEIQSQGIVIVNSAGIQRSVPFQKLDGSPIKVGAKEIPWKDIQAALDNAGIDLESDKMQSLITEQRQAVEAEKPTQEEIDRSAKIRQLREEIRTSRPPQSNPELAARVEKIEQILRLRDVEI